MRLDELNWTPGSKPHEYAWPTTHISVVRVVGSEVYTLSSYDVGKRGYHLQAMWRDLDALTAQAVLFHLTSHEATTPCTNQTSERS